MIKYSHQYVGNDFSRKELYMKKGVPLIVIIALIILITIVSLIIIVGSSIYYLYFANPIPIHQATENIDKIELVENAYDDEPTVYTLPDNKIENFMKDLNKISTSRRFSPTDYYGESVIYIYYENGDTDIIGSSCFAYVYSSGAYDLDGWYSPDREDFEELFDKYTT